MAVFFVTDASGDELFLDWSGGSTSTLYHNIGGPDEIPAPIYYDEGQTAPVADGSYIVEPDDRSTSLLIQVSNGIVTSIGQTALLDGLNPTGMTDVAVFFVTDASGDELFLDWSGGSTSTLYATPNEVEMGISPLSMAPIYYDEAQTAPVADGSYMVEYEDGTYLNTQLEIQVSNGIITSIVQTSVLTGSGSGNGQLLTDRDIVSVYLPSCRNISETAQANPQAIVDAVKSELIKLRNNPMAFGSITNRIIYLILNGQSAPRNFNTRFVKPVDTVRNIVSVALKDSVKDSVISNQPIGGQLYGSYSYETFNGNPFPGYLYYIQSTNGLNIANIRIGTEVFTNRELSMPAADGDYTSTLNGDITVLAGTVTAFTPPAAAMP